MIDADALVQPGLWVLIAVIMASCALVCFGRKGIVTAILLYAVAAAANATIALNVTEFGELGLGIVAMVTLAMPIVLVIAGMLGEVIREGRASPGKRHGSIGE